MTKIRDNAFSRLYRGKHRHQTVKGLRPKERSKGDAVKLGGSARQTEIEANLRQCSILRKYIRELRETRILNGR